MGVTRDEELFFKWKILKQERDGITTINNIYKQQEIEMGEVEIDERKRGVGRQIRRDSFKVKDSNTRKRILLCKRVYTQEGHEYCS